MGHQIILQPDGRLAVFEGHGETWATWDMTDDEVAGYLAEQAASAAREKALRDIALVRAGDATMVYTRRGAMTFAEANARSQYSGGDVLDGPVDEAMLKALEAFA